MRSTISGYENGVENFECPVTSCELRESKQSPNTPATGLKPLVYDRDLIKVYPIDDTAHEIYKFIIVFLAEGGK